MRNATGRISNHAARRRPFSSLEMDCIVRSPARHFTPIRETVMTTLETLDVAAVATLLHAEPDTIMQRASKGELPGTRSGKSWMFLRDDVLAFLKAQVDKDTAARRRRQTSPPVLAVAVPPPAHRRRTALPVLPPLLGPPSELSTGATPNRCRAGLRRVAACADCGAR